MKKITPFVLILLAALAFWIPAIRDHMKARQALLDSKTGLMELRSRLDADEAALASAQQQRDDQFRSREKMSVAVAKAHEALARKNPDGQWADPPESLPDWNPKSPYIWVPKEFLPQLHPRVFEANGSLTREAVSILAIDDATRDAINAQLARAVADFGNIEFSKAQQSNKTLDGSAADGPVVTVSVNPTPDEDTQLSGQIAQILDQGIGSQRASLVTNIASDWLENFSSQTSISVIRHPDGTYKMDLRSGGSSSSYGGIQASSVQEHIPQYLMPFFTDILNPAPSSE